MTGGLARAGASRAHRPARAGRRPDHRRGGRRSQRHRHLFPGRRAVRLRDAVDHAADAAADGRDPARQRAHRLRYAARPGRQHQARFSANSAVGRGRTAADGQHAQPGRGYRRDGAGGASGRGRAGRAVCGGFRRAQPDAAGVHALSGLRALAQMADAGIAGLCRGRLHRRGGLASPDPRDRPARPGARPRCAADDRRGVRHHHQSLSVLLAGRPGDGVRP